MIQKNANNLFWNLYFILRPYGVRQKDPKLALDATLYQLRQEKVEYKHFLVWRNSEGVRKANSRVVSTIERVAFNI